MVNISGKAFKYITEVNILCTVVTLLTRLQYLSGCMANTQDTLRSAFKNVSDVEMSLMISGLPIGGLFGGLSAGLIAGI